MDDFTAFQDLFTNPAWFLAGVNADRGLFNYVRTDEGTIRRSAFLDGRTPISIDDRVLDVPIDSAVAWIEVDSPPHTPDRILAHVSFCGSTLLARLLQGDGDALSYSEPQTLVELATLKAKSHKIASDPQRWTAILKFALSQYRKTWTGKPALIKPSNWVNTLLPDLIAASGDIKLALVDTDIEDYLIANLRGGKGRLTYSLNLLNHFLSGNNTYRGQVLEVERRGLEPVQRLLRLLMIIYETQHGLLERATQQLLDPQICRVSKAELQTEPAATIAKAALALHIPMRPAVLEIAIQRDMGLHAKDPKMPFRPDAEAAENVRLRQELAGAFDEALAWRQTALRAVA